MKISPGARYTSRLALAGLFAAVLASAPLAAQISSEGPINVGPNSTPLSFNSVGDGSLSQSGDMENAADLFVRYDLEVGQTIYISWGEILAIGQITAFDTPNRLSISTIDQATGDDDPELRLRSRHGVRLYADVDGDTALFDSFVFYNNGAAISDTVAELHSSGGLAIGGTLNENAAFDLSESFLAGESLRPGELVRIAPDDPATVLRSDGGPGRDVIGVVSARPGIVMGGGAFSVAGLREVWGDEVGDRFEAERGALEVAVLADSPGFARRLEMASWPRPAVASGDGSGPRGEQDGGKQDEEENDLVTLAGDLERAALKRFFERHFVPVALVGRVPVLVDSAFGAISPGDYLAPSPIPGVAMRASRPGPFVGIALEAFDGGVGRVVTLMQRGWYGGDGPAE